MNALKLYFNNTVSVLGLRLMMIKAIFITNI